MIPESLRPVYLLCGWVIGAKFEVMTTAESAKFTLAKSSPFISMCANRRWLAAPALTKWRIHVPILLSSSLRFPES